LQHKNAKVVQGSNDDVMGVVAFLLFQTQQISDKNNTLYPPARNLGKEIKIKIIQRNYNGRE